MHPRRLPHRPTTKAISVAASDAEVVRARLLAAGREIFCHTPYFTVSDDQICETTGVAASCVRQHFGGKLGLFTAVFESLQQNVSVRIGRALNYRHNPWEQVHAGITEFLDGCSEPAYRRVVLEEGPEVIGWERWRELDSIHYAHRFRAFVDLLTPIGISDVALTMFVATMRGALTEVAFAVAQASEHEQPRQHALAVVEMLLNTARQAPAHSGAPTPIRIGPGQLRAHTSTYLDHAAAGQTISILRRGRLAAHLTPPTPLSHLS